MVKRYLLDTCTVSDFVAGRGNTMQKLRSLSPSDMALSSVTAMELLYGLALLAEGPKRKRLQPLIHDMLGTVAIIPYDAAIAAKTATLRVSLKRSGTGIGAYDLLIAATALERNLTLATSNAREFARIKELDVENWLDAA